jgi:hypothetical protein
MRLGFTLTETVPDVSVTPDARAVLLEIWSMD